MKKNLVKLLMFVLIVCGLFISVNNFVSTNLEANERMQSQDKGTYLDLGEHGWICSGPPDYCRF